MKNLTVIIPLDNLETEEKKNLLTNALKSIDDSKIIIVGPKKAMENLETMNLSSYKYSKITSTDKDKTYAAQVNMAAKEVKTEFFSVLEYDDAFTGIWFKNVSEYISADTDNTFAFLPLTEVKDYKTGEVIGYSNEAVWASSFSDVIGYYDLQCIEDYLGFNASGGVFRTEDFNNAGGLKASMKLVNWYEFFMRMLYKGKKIFVIPKVGYYHVVNRPGSITDAYNKEMSEKEVEWWIDLAKKEYFFPQDRNKVYSGDSE